jgi:3-dehydroquinate synthase
MDHELFDEEMLDRGTKAIMKTRDGKLRAVVPSPIGACTFLNDVTSDQMNAALRRHKELMKQYPRQGAGIDAYVDASDTGYTINETPENDVAAENTLGKIDEDIKNGSSNSFISSLKEVLPLFGTS